MKKTINHTPEFIAKHDARIKARLLVQLKSEDPRYFICPMNPNRLEVISIPRLPGEVFELIPGTTRYYVSNKGRALKLVYDKFTDVYLEHPIALMKSKNKTGKNYIDIIIQNVDGEHLRVRLTRAMAKTFLDSTFGLLFSDDKRIVDHIDNNSENNTLENLRICSQNENIMYAIFDQGCSVGAPKKKCYAYNVNTKEVREYASTGELCRDIWSSSNKGYFHTANKNKATTKHGWKVGYDLEVLKGGKND